MNKTVSINIGGLFFHIDDNAYNQLNTYFNTIKNSLSEDSKEEVMHDIETRVAELLGARIVPDKQVINHMDIDYIISVMGKPEDYIIDQEQENNFTQQAAPNYTAYGKRKLFRDTENGKISGVSTGIAHYIGVDPIWVQLFFILIVLAGFGSGILVYIGFWLLVPAAVTTSDKLLMHGEPITVSNIEKKIKEGYDKVSNTFQEYDPKTFKKKVNTGVDKSVSSIERVLVGIAKAIAIAIGVFLMIISLCGMAAVTIFSGLITFYHLFDPNMQFGLTEQIVGEGFNTTLFGILVFFSSIIPLLFLFLLSIKIINPNSKPIGKYFTLSMIALWILALFGWIYFGITTGMQNSTKANVTQTEFIELAKKDTLMVYMNNNAFYSTDPTPNFTKKMTLDQGDNNILYSNRVEIEFRESQDGTYSTIIERSAKENTLKNAKQIANQINYQYNIENNKLRLDNYFTSAPKNFTNDQRVYIYVYVPKDVVIKVSKEVLSYSNLYDENPENDMLFKLGDNQEWTRIHNNNNNNKEEQNVQTQTNSLVPTGKTTIEREVDSLLNASNIK
ncbi:MAG: PspC domain-containing protein [Flavobacterium sp.]|nr:PspC domain-containing protein [Candidatus Neoflavobacterium equi]